MNTKPRHLPPSLAQSNVIQFARHAAAKESPLTRKVRAINKANAEFWSKPGPNVVQAGYAFAQLEHAQRKTEQQQRAKKPRPQRKAKHAERDQRIRKDVADGKTPKQIAADAGLTASQVRKILNPPTKTRA